MFTEDQLKASILIVDDQYIVRQGVARLLQFYGFETILYAHSGTAALKILFDQKPSIDIMIIDLIMPGMHGDHVLDVISNQYELSLSIIVMSHFPVSEGQLRRILKSPGVIRFLQKDFIISDLASALLQGLCCKRIG